MKDSHHLLVIGYVFSIFVSDLFGLAKSWAKNSIGKQIAVMAHLNHWRELDTHVAKEHRHAICSASNDAKQDHHDRDDQQYVNQSAHGV
jgi:hypothetical protein